ncbi:hypothetical protein EVAR_3439_1 [Eumeta japonica]|uniref:Uncharacterized protein n=1 Tax=Eumeta variegata TaxID=151549 RepID=A0A4C1ST50_EUMVA|nr:hypothetical protein EVAR_3439_1 [Eumeta japonica]
MTFCTFDTDAYTNAHTRKSGVRGGRRGLRELGGGEICDTGSHERASSYGNGIGNMDWKREELRIGTEHGTKDDLTVKSEVKPKTGLGSGNIKGHDITSTVQRAAGLGAGAPHGELASGRYAPEIGKVITAGAARPGRPRPLDVFLNNVAAERAGRRRRARAGCADNEFCELRYDVKTRQIHKK